ncbi:hypothetical protein BVG19_g4329 [[Candida] boidinii]|nr:hypothetical protein BVG19_g4329 [[Candida] boidinii]OWB49458.1 hypothetical protein B5S27_g999 [[Candida] boidinii]
MSVSRHIIRRFGTSQHILKKLKPIDTNTTTTNKTIKTQEVQQQNEFQRTLQLLKSKLDASKNIKTVAVEGMVTEDNKNNKYIVRKSFRDEDLVDLKDNINLVFHENVIFNSPDFLDTLNTEIINKFPEIEFHKDEIRDQFKFNINQYFKKSDNQQLILKKRGKEKILKEIIRNIYWPFFVNNTDEGKLLSEFKFLMNEKFFINHICEIIINNYRINNKFENYLKRRNINKQRINNNSRIFFLNDSKWDYYLFNFNQFNSLKNLIFKLNKINSFNSSNNASNIKLINIENNISDNNKFKLKLLSENSDVISSKLNINSNNSTSLFISNDKDVSLEYFKMVKFLQSNHKNDNFKVVYIQENKSGYRSGIDKNIDRGDDYDRYQFILNSSREEIPDKFDIVKNSEIYENLIKSQDLAKVKKLKDQIKEENYITVNDISQIDILTSILNA